MRSHDDLARRLNTLCDERPYRCCWVVEDLRTGRRIAREAESVVPAASTRKVAIMLAALAAVEGGALDLGQPVVIDERFRDRVFTGTLQHLGAGLELSLRDALTLMIVLSDNLCTGHVVELVGLDAVNELCERLGLSATVHRHALIPRLPPDHPLDAVNVTSAGDQAVLYRTLLAAATDATTAARIGCGTELCGLALRILAAQQHRELIPALLPFGTVVAHKTGVGWRDIADGGIVYRDGAPLFLATVYVDGVPDAIDGLPGIADARSLISRLSRCCWDTFD